VYRSSRTIFAGLAPLVAEADRQALLRVCISTLEGVRSGRLGGRNAAGVILDALAPGLPKHLRDRARLAIEREVAIVLAAAEVEPGLSPPGPAPGAPLP
jgi:hypothetical protein